MVTRRKFLLNSVKFAGGALVGSLTGPLFDDGDVIKEAADSEMLVAIEKLRQKCASKVAKYDDWSFLKDGTHGLRYPEHLSVLRTPIEMGSPQNSIEAGRVAKALEQAFEDARAKGLGGIVDPNDELLAKQVSAQAPPEFYIDPDKKAVAVKYPYEPNHIPQKDFEVDLIGVARVMHDKYRELYDGTQSAVLPQYRSFIRDVAEMPDIIYMSQTGEFGRALLDAFEDIRAENAGFVDLHDEQLAKIMDMLSPEVAQPQVSLDA